MAIDNKGTKNSISTSKLPSGYTPPTITEFDDAEYDSVLTLSVLKSTVENADPAVTMANIIDDAAIGITKQITDIITADYIGTQNVEAYAEIVDISNNVVPSASTDFYGNVAVSYICKVNLFVKTS